MPKSNSASQSGKEHQRTTSVMSEGTKRTLIAFHDQEAEVSLRAHIQLLPLTAAAGNDGGVESRN